MDLESVAVIAASGLLAVLVGSIFFGKGAGNKALSAIVIVGLFYGFHSAAINYVMPYFDDAPDVPEFDRPYAHIPGYLSFKSHSPSKYRLLVKYINNYDRQGRPDAEKVAKIEKLTTKLIKERIPNASNKALKDYAASAVSQIGYLQSQGGDDCYRLLFPDIDGPVRSDVEFPGGVQSKAEAALDEVIRTSEEVLPAASEAEAGEILRNIILQLRAQYGNDVSVFTKMRDYDVNRDKVCELSKALYKNITNLPLYQAGPVLRWMFTGRGGF